ncbi:MAG: hypothetical protein ED555_06795 [Allomuricauda sp.]|nr:MAG: hypothetical protein ED555_06795 [Allomuricauda sp.]
MRLFFLVLGFFVCSFVQAQNDSLPKPRLKNLDTFPLPERKSPDSTAINKKSEAKALAIEDYKIITLKGDTTFLDTTQSIKKEYKYNFLREDDFELMPFANVGQPYNRLAHDFKIGSLYPNLGAVAKHVNYKETDEIVYYHVPTPLTDLMFKTTFEQGQFLDALLTFNTSPGFNASIAFTGVRSLGKYQFEQSQAGNFRTTFNYSSKNKRYFAKGHITAQNLDTEENGGLLDRSQFESGLADFTDRSRIDVRYTNADNRLLGRRYFLDHKYVLLKARNDSVKTRGTSLAIGHQFNYESKFYQFLQSTANSAFGDESFSSAIDDKSTLKTMYNQLSAEFYNKTLGKVVGKVGFYDYDYFFNSLLITESQTITNQLEGQELVMGGAYANQIGKFSLEGDFNITMTGELSGNQFDARASYQLNESNLISAAIHSSSRLPNFNYLLYQSDYLNFNWQNTAQFEKQNVQQLALTLDSKLLGKLSATYSTIDNYTYFASTITDEQLANGELETAYVRPFQEGNTLNYLQVKLNKEFKWRNWALNNTVLYQNVSQSNALLNVPELVTRNTLYYSSDVFKKAMFVQTGVTFKYFTAYNMNAYHPLLGEFFVQNREELGGYPLMDFFINAKVRQTRIFLKAEHFNTLWSSEYNYYAAPNYPYRDFVIRFGLVWNFFS